MSIGIISKPLTLAAGNHGAGKACCGPVRLDATASCHSALSFVTVRSDMVGRHVECGYLVGLLLG